MSAISSNDCVQPFYFRDIAARGAIVKMQNSFVEALNGHQYPAAINRLLGECITASSLMSTHLKFSSRLSIHARSIQAQAKFSDTTEIAPVNMLVAESHMKISGDNADSEENMQAISVRGLARIEERIDAAKLQQALQNKARLGELLGQSQLAVTIEPDRGERYQGIVNAQAESLSASLEDYFRQSEQLDTRFYLFVGDTQCAGLMMQEMPNHGGKSERHPIGFEDEFQSKLWEELVVLASSIKEQELFNLTPEDCLHRLFHQHDYGLRQPAPVHFRCSCSREGTVNALRNIAYDELDSILKEEGEITLDCEFCSSRYRFDRDDIDAIKGIPRAGSRLN